MSDKDIMNNKQLDRYQFMTQKTFNRIRMSHYHVNNELADLKEAVVRYIDALDKHILCLIHGDDDEIARSYENKRIAEQALREKWTTKY